jgi:hypothetical protein
MTAVFAAKAHRRWKASNDSKRHGHRSQLVVPQAFVRIAASLLAIAVLTAAYADDGTNLKRGNPLWGIPLSELQTTVDRPLFSPSRRPPPPPVAAAVVASPLPPPPPAEPERPPLALLGTIVGEIEIAVFLDETTKDTVRLKVGQNHGGWTLRSVRGREVDFERDRRMATLAIARGADEKQPAHPEPSAAGVGFPDMEAYRLALHRKLGR